MKSRKSPKLADPLDRQMNVGSGVPGICARPSFLDQRSNVLRYNVYRAAKELEVEVLRTDRGEQCLASHARGHRTATLFAERRHQDNLGEPAREDRKLGVEESFSVTKRITTSQKDEGVLSLRH